MSTNTTNYNLKKPGVDDFYNVADQNGNMDIVDQQIKAVNDKADNHAIDTGKHVTTTKQAAWDQNTTDIATLGTRIDKREILNTTTLTAAGWSGTAPYTQTVAVTGITAGRLPDKIIPQYSATTATAILQKEAFSMISYYDTGAGTITFTCLEDKPVTAIPLQIVGV